MVIIGDEGEPDPNGQLSSSEPQLDERAARSAASALQQLASATDVRVSALDLAADPRTSTPLTRLACASDTGMYTAAYLALASGIDPSAPWPGELS